MNCRFCLLFIALVSTSAPINAASHPIQHGCFEQHLAEAVALNQQRTLPYFALSQGKSLMVSKALIASEQAGRLFAKYFDRRAIVYQKAGIPLFCLDFVAISPLFDQAIQKKTTVAALPDKWPDVGSLQGTLRQAISQQAWQSMQVALETAIADIAQAEDYHCLYRHTLESIARAALLAPYYEKLARDRGLASPVRLTQRFLRLQVETLSVSTWIDRLAAPVQAEGLPILCQDVPKIPYQGPISDLDR